MSVCPCLSVCVSQWASPGCTVDKKGQRKARGVSITHWMPMESRRGSTWIRFNGGNGFTVSLRCNPLYGQCSPVIYGKKTDASEGNHRRDWRDSSGWCGGRVQLWTHATVQGHAGGDWVLLCSHRRGEKMGTYFQWAFWKNCTACTKLVCALTKISKSFSITSAMKKRYWYMFFDVHSMKVLKYTSQHCLLNMMFLYN